MFNKKESNIFGNIDIKKPSVYQVNNHVLITPSFVMMLNDYKDNKLMSEKLDYENNKVSYINRKNELKEKKQYNEDIVNLYNNGKIIINNKEYLLRELFIVYKESDKIFNLLITNEENNLSYNHAIKFIDTTVFINIIKKFGITNNTITIDDMEVLNIFIHKWDGKLHSEVPETDAIINKNIIGDDNNE